MCEQAAAPQIASLAGRIGFLATNANRPGNIVRAAVYGNGEGTATICVWFARLSAIAAFRFFDRVVICAHVAAAHQRFIIKLPMLLAVSAVPPAVGVVPLVFEAHPFPYWLERESPAMSGPGRFDYLIDQQARERCYVAAKYLFSCCRMKFMYSCSEVVLRASIQGLMSCVAT